MVSLTQETQLEKAQRTMREAVSYAQQIINDERLRADMRAAVDHGAKVSGRVKKDIEAGGISRRLAADKKLRKNLRAMLDDLDDAAHRVRPKRTHRARNAVLVLGGAVAAALAFPRVWPWLEKQASDILGTSTSEPEPMT